MKLNSITLQNFKGIDNLEIKLDNKTTVIFGVNGVGKSTILQAIDLLYADIIAKLMGTVRSKTARFNEDFINNRQPHYKVDFAGNDSDGIERRMLREALIKAGLFIMPRSYLS